MIVGPLHRAGFNSALLYPLTVVVVVDMNTNIPSATLMTIETTARPSTCACWWPYVIQINTNKKKKLQKTLSMNDCTIPIPHTSALTNGS